MKATFNRLANVSNRHQGSMKKVLCVCSAGLLRSPTLAWVLSNPPYNFNTRAAGVSDEYALIPVDIVLVEWADEIVCADGDHLHKIQELLKDINVTNQKKPVHVLDIPDSYGTRDPKLVKIIRQKVAKIFPQSKT
jgi:predicted protein tyrosine phosphatase